MLKCELVAADAASDEQLAIDMLRKGDEFAGPARLPNVRVRIRDKPHASRRNGIKRSMWCLHPDSIWGWEKVG